MKLFLLAVLMAVTTSAFGASAMVATNGVGGVIVLTNEQPEFCGKNHLAYATEPLSADDPDDFITYWGCWVTWKGEVYIHYFIGVDGHHKHSEFQQKDIAPINIPAKPQAATPSKGT